MFGDEVAVFAFVALNTLASPCWRRSETLLPAPRAKSLRAESSRPQICIELQLQ